MKREEVKWLNKQTNKQKWLKSTLPTEVFHFIVHTFFSTKNKLLVSKMKICGKINLSQSPRQFTMPIGEV